MTEQRSTRAVSADGRWVVECGEPFCPKTQPGCWTVYDMTTMPRMAMQSYPDTGQRAEDVLAQWEQENRNGN